MKIGYQSELSNDYARALDAAKTLEGLRDTLNQWQRVANDAREIVATWTVGDFSDWRKALAKERRGKFMGNDAAKRFVLVLMPDVLFEVQRVAIQFMVPWGVAFIRMKDAGMITERNDIAVVNRSPTETPDPKEPR